MRRVNRCMAIVSWFVHLVQINQPQRHRGTETMRERKLAEYIPFCSVTKQSRVEIH
jgi:hypothetical protein